MKRLVQHHEMAAFLLKPVLLAIYAFGFWCLAAQMGWAGEFVIQDGPFGNWMVWMGLAGAMHFAMKRLTALDAQRVAALRDSVTALFRSTRSAATVENFVTVPVTSPNSEAM